MTPLWRRRLFASLFFSVPNNLFFLYKNKKRLFAISVKIIYSEKSEKIDRGGGCEKSEKICDKNSNLKNMRSISTKNISLFF